MERGRNIALLYWVTSSVSNSSHYNMSSLWNRFKNINMDRYNISKHPYLDRYYQVYDNYTNKIVHIGSYYSCKEYIK